MSDVLKPEDFKHNVVIVTENNPDYNNWDTFKRHCHSHEAWDLNPDDRAEQAEFVLVKQGNYIIEIFKIKEHNIKDYPLKKWYQIAGFKPKRYGFIGGEADKSVKELYLGKKLDLNMPNQCVVISIIEGTPKCE